MKLRIGLLAAIAIAVVTLTASQNSAQASRPLTDSQMTQMGWRQPSQAPQPFRNSPIGYGYVNSDGSKASGTANVSTSYDPGTGRYGIHFANLNYYYSHYSTTITYSIPIGGAECRSDSVGGNLLVYCYDLTGAQTTAAFGFITF